jgi:hypothetical protein
MPGFWLTGLCNPYEKSPVFINIKYIYSQTFMGFIGIMNPLFIVL